MTKVGDDFLNVLGLGGLDGTIKTPERFARAWQYLTSGYDVDIDSLFTVFDSEGYDQMILLKDIEFYSTCEHHLLPFFGKASIAYIPRDKIVGISKLARVVDVFARRLQNQERLTEQIAKLLWDKLNPLGVAVVLEAEHLCIKMRGVEKQNSKMKTMALLGTFQTDAKARAEFYSALK